MFGVTKPDSNCYSTAVKELKQLCKTAVVMIGEDFNHGKRVTFKFLFRFGPLNLVFNVPLNFFNLSNKKIEKGQGLCLKAKH